MKKKNRKLHNNAGMSLVEIVVVVLIIGILSAGAVIGFSFINSRDASSAAENIMSTLERTKLDTLASNTETVLLKLCKENNHYYGIVMKDSTELDKIELAKNGVTITVKDTSGGQTVISDSTSYELKYNKSNGSFASAANEIVVSGANTVTVRLVTLTGRSYME